jgi:hypothetical protein
VSEVWHPQKGLQQQTAPVIIVVISHNVHLDIASVEIVTGWNIDWKRHGLCGFRISKEPMGAARLKGLSGHVGETIRFVPTGEPPPPYTALPSRRSGPRTKIVPLSPQTVTQPSPSHPFSGSDA